MPIKTFDFADVAPGLFERNVNSSGIVIYVEDQIPDPKRDAGSKRANQIISAMQALGLHVVLLTLNNNVDDLVLNNHRHNGVEIYVNINEFLEKINSRSSRVKYLWIAREGVAREFWTPLKKRFPNVPLIFDTVDLVHLRTERKESVQKMKGSMTNPIEKYLIEKSEVKFVEEADHSVVCSEFERQHLISKGISKERISTVWATEDFESNAKFMNSKKDYITFIGSFMHEPNVDAVEWLVEQVLPIIRKQSPSLLRNIRVAGFGLSAELQYALESFGIEYLGWVADLGDIYRKTRIVIAPLRYGAGMKGKILEAISFNCPILTTSVGAEGFPFEHGTHILVTDSAAEFARTLVNYYSKPSLLSKMSRNALIVAQKEFSFKNLLDGVGRVFAAANHVREI